MLQPEVARKYGGGVTYKAVWGQINVIKKGAKSINDACAQGVDPITVNLGDGLGPAHREKPEGRQFAKFSSFPPLVKHSTRFILQTALGSIYD